MTAGVYLIGGGWSAAAAALVYGPFLREAGANARIACLVIDEGDGPDQFQRWASVLVELSSCRPFPVLVPIGEVLDLEALAGADALLVCGGLTPAYAAAVGPVSMQLKDWLSEQPYCGFSAGASIASSSAVVGGWLLDGRPVIPEDAAEDLDEVTVVAGLDLVPFVVDVHAAQWGTLPRLLTAAVLADRPGIAIDEDTMVSILDGELTVAGLGHAHLAMPAGGEWTVRRFAAGDRMTLR